MSDQIIDLHHWFQTPAGRYLLDWERAQYEQAVADIFGYHAVQLGMADVDALHSNRMPHRWLALDAPGWGGVLLAGFANSIKIALGGFGLGLLIGIARDIAHTLEVFTNDTVCRHGAWYIANCGFGISCEACHSTRSPTTPWLFLPREWQIRRWPSLLLAPVGPCAP